MAEAAAIVGVVAASTQFADQFLRCARLLLDKTPEAELLRTSVRNALLAFDSARNAVDETGAGPAAGSPGTAQVLRDVHSTLLELQEALKEACILVARPARNSCNLLRRIRLPPSANELSCAHHRIALAIQCLNTSISRLPPTPEPALSTATQNESTPQPISGRSFSGQQFNRAQFDAEELGLQDVIARSLQESLPRLSSSCPANPFPAVGGGRSSSSPNPDSDVALELLPQELLSLGSPSAFHSPSSPDANWLRHEALASKGATPLDEGFQIFSEELFCDLCQEAKPFGSMAFLECGHDFCLPCLSRHSQAAVEAKKIPIACPAPGCSSFLSEGECERVLGKESYSNAMMSLAEQTIPDNEKFFCPYSDCSMLMALEASDVADNPRAKCSGCLRDVCTACNVPWHGWASCHEYQTA